MGRAYPGTVRMLVRRRAGFVAAVSLAILLSACGRSVGVDPLPIDGPQTRSACAALVAALPQQISAGRIWRVEPDPSSASAWGSPAVVLRCGSSVPQPPSPSAIANAIAHVAIRWRNRAAPGDD